MPTTIAPVVKTRRLACSVEHAFDTFTRDIGQWWPTATHAINEDVVDVVLEPQEGGSMHEVASDGTTTAWGKVTAWDRPHRVAFTWHLSRTEGTHVEVTFTDTPDGCELRLVHDDWANWGEAGADRRQQYDAGWDVVLARYLDRVAPR